MHTVNKVFPMLAVKNLRKSVEFYRNKLGFKIDFVDYKKADYASMSRAGAVLMFHGVKTLDPTEFSDKRYLSAIKRLKKRGLGAFLYVESLEVDRYYASLRRKRVRIIAPLRDTDWGSRSFGIEDPDGYAIVFYKMKKMARREKEEE